MTSANPNASPIPITILTGFLGSGKTTLLLSLLPQLPPGYKLCLLKNELGDVTVDSQLASQNSVAGVTELTNGCICCNLVGQLSDALVNLKDNYKPSRIVIETSGSAFPATLAMEVNRLSAAHPNSFSLDGVIQVIDVENWQGYEDTSYTAKLQAKYTDLIVLNKHDLAGPQKEEIVMDRIRDVAEETPIVRTNKGRIDAEVIFGLDSSLAKNFTGEEDGHEHKHEHHDEVDVLTVTLPIGKGEDERYLDGETLRQLLTTAPRDEVYRIKGILRLPPFEIPHDPNALSEPPTTPTPHDSWILNWAFGRWSLTPLREYSVSTYIESPPTVPQSPEEEATEAERGLSVPEVEKAMARKGSIEVMVETSIQTTVEESVQEVGDVARLNFVLARGEGRRWVRKLEQGNLVRWRNGGGEGLKVRKLN